MKLALHLTAVLVGALAAEGFTRATIEPDAMFEIAFSPGAKVPDERFGFLYAPHFDGYMRHPDRVWAVPLQLDQYGYRPPARTPGAEDPLAVVLISGRSMTMCYGLPQDETLQEFMVRSSERPLEVHNTGGAGIDPYRGWHYFEERLAEDVDFDVALFCVNPGEFAPFADLPEDLETIPRHPLQDRFFYMLPGNIRLPKDALEEWLGPNYFRSYVVYGLLRYREFPQRWLARLQRAVGGPPAAGPRDEDDAARTALGRERFTQFWTRLAEHYRARGVRFGVVMLPSIKHPIDAYDGYQAALPPEIARVDLQRRLIEDMPFQEWIGLGHFNERHSELVARELLAFVEELIGPPSSITSEPKANSR